MRRAGGQLVANGRIPVQAILAAIEAETEEEADTTAEDAADAAAMEPQKEGA